MSWELSKPLQDVTCCREQKHHRRNMTHSVWVDGQMFSRETTRLQYPLTTLKRTNHTITLRLFSTTSIKLSWTMSVQSILSSLNYFLQRHFNKSHAKSSRSLNLFSPLATALPDSWWRIV